MGAPFDTSPGSARPPGDRLDSWKEIAAYLSRDITTVQRWERREGMPVHRHVHDKLGSVYAFRSEVDAWVTGRANLKDGDAPAHIPPDTVDDARVASGDDDRGSETAEPLRGRRVRQPSRARGPVVPLAAATLLLLLAAWWFVQRSSVEVRDPLDEATFQRVTDFEGTEQSAAVSRDGRFVAFVSDRDGPMDVWVTQLGTGQFYNLTRGRVRELVNPDVRTLGFSPDGALVTFWARGIDGVERDDISIWAVPTLGGHPRPYLEGAAECDWSPDGSRVVYHTPGPGDPTFVADTGRRPEGPPIFTAPAGRHAHFPTWSRDGAFIYFVQGSVPDAFDLYRVRRDGTDLERLTRHDAGVSHPVVVDRRTLMYLVREKDGSGPRLHALDVEQRAPRRLGTGVDRYYSLAASADGRHLVATRADTTGTLWRLPVDTSAPAGVEAATPIVLPTARGFSPRLGDGYMVYVSSKGNGHGIWKLVGDAATEIWGSADARIIGGPEIAPDGRRVTFSVDHDGKTLLYVMNADGTGARVVSETLALQGSPGWTHDGQSLTSGATIDGKAQLVKFALDGTVSPLVQRFAVNPAWSPDGSVVVYSGADVGTQFPLEAAVASGSAHAIPDITLTRGARRLRFARQGRAIIVMRGDMRHKDLWLVDLDTAVERQLTNLPHDFLIRDFDVSADGREIVVERVQEHSDIVLIELETPR